MHHSSSAAVSEVLTPSQNAVPIQSHSKPGTEDSKSSPQRSSAATTTTSETSDKDRGSIYTHPLFPLMALLFEKCEQATQSPDPPTSDSFDVDIEEFVNRQKREGKPFFSDDTEVDNLMIKAIQVLRIHLLELEKVNELCKDFCHRYITCLKGKMHSENLLKEERSPTSQSDEGNTAAQNITDQMHSQSHSSTMQLENQFTQTQYQTAVMNSGGQVVYTPVYPPGVVTPGLVTQAIPGAVQIQSASNAHNQMVIHGSTPLSQIGISQQPVSQSQSSMALQNMNSLGDTAEVNDLLNKRKPKRGVLPKQATNIMRSWLFQHIVHPYPTEDEKRMIAAQTNLTLLQVNNWFINARRRILQPMLDASNPEAAKAKKQKTSNRPSTQRFWPQSLANLGQTTTTTQSSAGTAKTTESDSSSRSAQLSPELPQLQPPRNPLSPSSILNNSTAGSPHMVDVSVNSESESDNDSDSQAFQTS